MIYLFGTEDQVSVIMHERFLTEEQQAKATLVLETLPEPEEREGYYAVRYIDKVTKEFSYIYREIVEEEMNELVEAVKEKRITLEQVPLVYVNEVELKLQTEKIY